MLNIGAYGGGGNVYNALKQINSKMIFLADMALPLALTLPDRISIGRITFQQQSLPYPFNSFAQQPLEALPECYYHGALLAELLVQEYPYIDIWQLYNESVADGDFESYRKLAEFELGATRQLHELNKKSCVLNLGVGVAFPKDYIRYFGKLLGEADYLGIHAYGSKKDQLMNGPDQQWYARRFELILDAARECNARIPPTIITECTTFDPWHGYFNSQQILDDIIWLSTICYSNPFVAGVFPFQIGHPGNDFKGFELSDQLIIDGIAEWVENHKDKQAMEFPVLFPLEANKCMEQDERIKLYEKLFENMGGLNDNVAIHKFWIEQTNKYIDSKEGKWYGPPVTQETRTNNGRYVYQVFACAPLYCEVDVWNVMEGLPPL